MRWIAICGLCCVAGSVRAQDAAPQPTRQDLQGTIRRYRRSQPAPAAVVEAALRASPDDPERVSRMVSRARMRGWIPTLRLGVRRGQGWDQSALRTVDSGRTNVSVDDELSLQAWMTFRLDRLVYSGDEVALLRERRALEAARRELVATVMRIYFERLRLLIERDLMGQRDLPRALRIEESTALLNAFTNGEFRRMMQSLRSR